MPVWPVASANSIFVGGAGIVIEEFEASEEIYPGDLVEFTNADALDKTIKPAVVNSSAVLGVADISVHNKDLRGGKRTLPYAAGDVVKMIKGPINVMLRLAGGQDIDRGEMLMPAASGEVKAYNCATETSCTLIAQSLEDKVNYTDVEFILVEFKLP
ncbi:hypothetical protein LCGC14_1804670 [marine sediment metagenome]|uniref:Uncharacterized protein n=1 Tax=marine sediment metagenome TaxID=412755 RepID=A0A0F9JN75_9ZZZZ